VILLAALFAWLRHTGSITSEMITHPGYALWAHGSTTIQPDYIATFTRDDEFRQRLVGQPIEVLRPYFPKLHSGATYSPYSYRASGVQSMLDGKASGHRIEDYWVDGTEQNFDYCILVEDGKIRDFFFIKG